MPLIRIDEDAYLEFRETPWDLKSLGLTTREILDIRAGSTGQYLSLIKDFDEACISDRIDLAYVRIPAEELLAKHCLQDCRYRFVETSLKISSAVPSSAGTDGKMRHAMELTTACESDFPQIEEIAETAFNFGRFHEDPLIPGNEAALRYRYWIGEMRQQGCQFLVYRSGSKVISFMSYRLSGNTAELILGGSRQDQGFISVLFWPAVFKYLKEQSVHKVQTVISAANLGVMNLYISFGFRVERTLFGFSKFFSEK